jgi:hypothetical protein
MAKGNQVVALVACRECQHEVNQIVRKCPHCRAPNPARADWQGTGREWKSSTTIWGYPLIHIAYGRNAQGKLRVAKGVIAIGVGVDVQTSRFRLPRINSAFVPTSINNQFSSCL